MGIEIHLDYETYSPVDIKESGAFKYASQAEILIAAVALGDEEPVIWVPDDVEPLVDLADNKRAIEIMRMWEDPSVEVYAHNSQFEMAVSEYCLLRDVGVSPPAETQWRCTAAMCRKASIPASLEKSAKFLGCIEKDNKGLSLIRKFSILQKDGRRVMPYDELDKFEEFVDYCVKDVLVEREVGQALSMFRLKGESLRNFQADITINWEGVPVNVDGLQNASVELQKHEIDLAKRFDDLTYGLKPTQRNAILEFVQAAHDYPYDDLQRDTVERAVTESDNEELNEILQIRLDLSFAAVKKIRSMLACQIDGRVHGGMVYHGAHTGRSSGRLIQPQNFKRPDGSIPKNELAQWYDTVCKKDLGEIKECDPSPFRVAANVIRHFIHSPGRSMYQADYSNIEARVVLWLADETEALQEFVDGVDSYVSMAEKIYGLSYEAIVGLGKDCLERFVGKQAVLGCGFGLGSAGFKISCSRFGIELDESLCDTTIKAYRAKHSKLVSLWYECDKKMKLAIKYPGKQFKAGKLKFFSTNTGKFFACFMKLPSGRCVCYPKARIVPSSKWEGAEEIQYWGQIPNKAFFGWLKTYGGKIIENATQAVAADYMSAGVRNSIEKGVIPFMVVHDEALALSEHTSYEEFESYLTPDLEWAKGLPVEIEGKTVPYYTKG